MGSAKVYLAYRRSKAEMGAYEFEYDLAKSVGVEGIFNVSPIEILENQGAVSGVKFIRTNAINGKIQTVPGTEFILDCDWVIKATGQSKRDSLFKLITDLKLNSNGTIMVNETFQTSNTKYFAAGDAVSGGEEVVNAVANGKKAALSIAQLLGV
jgi:glutamate synthase (NADPH/NADH) small chain